MSSKYRPRGIVLDTDSCYEEKLKQVQPVEIERADSLEQLSRAVVNGAIDFVIIHELPNTKGLDLVRELRKSGPALPTILLCQAASGTWNQPVLDSQVELVSDTAQALELQHRIRKILNHVLDKVSPPQTRVAVNPIPDLRNIESGRLDAVRIATAFGMSLSDLTKAVNKPYKTVYKTPDSQALQASLYPFERIVSTINIMSSGNDKALKMWLNAPNKAFPDEIPVDIIRQGHVSLLADMLEDVLLGHPG